MLYRYSMSPETMKGHYTTKSDLWSIGICLFMMLSNGERPFEGKTPKQLVARVLTGDVQFNTALWDETSEESKQFIRSLLKVDPSERLTANDAMNDLWFRSRAVSSSHVSLCRQELIEEVQDSIVRYADTGEFRKLALNVIAKKSTSDEIFELRKVFDEFDTLNSGMFFSVSVLPHSTFGVSIDCLLTHLVSSALSNIRHDNTR